MDTLLDSRTWKWRAADWAAAAVSGFAASVVLMGFVIAPVREAFDLSAKVQVLTIDNLSAVWRAFGVLKAAVKRINGMDAPTRVGIVVPKWRCSQPLNH